MSIPSKKTILIAEDSLINRKILVKMLSTEYNTIEAQDGKEALELLGKNAPIISAVVLDLVMPVMDGFAFLKEIQNNEAYKNIPTIVATSNADDVTETKALGLGAWDFITKPYNKPIIRFRLRNAIERSQMSAFEQLKYLAEYDVLTGIYNKSMFFKETRKMLDAHPDEKFALVRLDIDRFQLINAFYGTEEGDNLLIYLAKNMAVEDKGVHYTYARIEGDVFAMCFAYTDKTSIIHALTKAREQVKAYNRNFDIVPIFGVYFIDEISLPISEMLDRATLAAKTCKGNYIKTIAFYIPELSQKLTQEQEIINEMVTALDEEQFCVYLQPKYALADNSPSGAEALVRWKHPKKGLIPPNVFIPVFEKNGFIAKLDFYVWESVCKHLHLWLQRGYRPFPISVNVSRVNLYNPNTPQIIEDLVKKYNLSPTLFELELTESAYMDNPQMMEQFVKNLHQKGFTILMDDFGSGYSSLSILKDIAVDVLKIDMRFFEHTKIAGRGENVFASVIRMAKWLKIPTISEGVETIEEVNFLRSVGCDYVQGYYFAKPMPVESYQKLIEENLSIIPEKITTEINGFNIDKLWSSDPEIELLFANSAQANCIYEANKNEIEILRVNKAFNKLFGYNKELKNTNPLDYIDINDHEAIKDMFSNCIDSKSIEECDYRRQDASGKVLWINVKLQYISSLGQKHVLMGHLSDITKEKIMEFEFRKIKTQSLCEMEDKVNVLVVSKNSNVINPIPSSKCNVTEVNSYVDALSTVNNENTDILLLDVDKIAKDDEQFIQRLNSSGLFSRVPFVVLTSENSIDEQTRALSLGASDYIIKPYSPELLQQKIITLVEYNKRFLEIVKETKNSIIPSIDDKLFAINQIYSSIQIRMIMAFLSPVFDVVRLVDPTETAIINISDNGELKKEKYTCFTVWNKNVRCENCISICAKNTSCRMTKYEFIQNNIFYVVSNPIIISDNNQMEHKLVLEIVSRVSDHLLLERQGKLTVEQLIEETQNKIYKDYLTGVYNRRYYQEMLFAYQGQNDVVNQMALVMLDLRGFKRINDEYGHAIGDDVLIRVARTLKNILRQSDSIIRYGGDEFIVILTNCTDEQAQNTIKRMREAIARIKYGNGKTMYAFADFGYSYTKHFDLTQRTLNELFSIADKAMYEEKNIGSK